MKLATLLSCAMILSVSVAPLASAQTPPPAAAPAATPPATTKPAMSADDKKAKSKECSTEADAKGLHGKERKKFREECKHGK